MSQHGHTHADHDSHDRGNAHADSHEHPHGDGQPHEHPHGHDHPHDHAHPSGLRGILHGLFVPHSHDAADSIDSAMETSARGIHAVKVSLAGLGVTALLQLVVVVISGSVALLADTIHNFSDALTAIPLWIAFILGRRPATRRYNFGLGRAEDLAGLFIVAMIALSAVGAGWQSVQRLLDPQPIQHLGWVFAAGLIGFAGNELVAIYRIRVGRSIGSAALVADGIHARTDGFTSLAVVAGVVGVWLGFPLADPIVGLIITAAIVVLLWGTARDIGRRLLDGVNPELVDRAESSLATVVGPHRVDSVRLRWSGHKLNVSAAVTLPAEASLEDFHALAPRLQEALRRDLPSIGEVLVTPAGRA